MGIPRIIYTSTIAVLGDTHGFLADESYHMPDGQPFVTEYDRTKWQAHYQVALPLIEQGAPIIVVMPGAVFGPGDHSLVGALMTAYQRGLLPVFPGPDSMLTFAHVEDIARGHLLAAEKGQPGQAYILAGPALSFRQFIALCAQASGKALPRVYVPSRWIKPLLPLSQLLSRLPSWPEILSPDAIRVLDVTYIASAEKARRELGWQPRPLEERLRESFGWLSGHTPPLLSSRQKMIAAAGLTGAALGILAARFLIPRLRSKGRK
jgi:nucleoside-diphosphate-sugar epimerase